MKTALVTGASSGMGRDFILEIAKNPGDIEEIWAVARRKERLDELSLLVDIPIKPIVLDLTSDESLAELDAMLNREQPDIRILINCAGFGKIGRFSELSYDDNVDMVKLNCCALTAVAHMSLKHMREGAKIIQLASSAAFLPQPKFAVYAATKSYVLSLSRAMAQELKGLKITVTAVCPGPVKTEFFGIAEQTGKIPLYKKLSMAESKKVVQSAMRAANKGKKVVTYGALMKCFRILCKILPHGLILRFFK